MLQVWHCVGVGNQKSQELLGARAAAHGCSCSATRSGVVQEDAAQMPAGMAELWEVFGIAADSFRKLESTELLGWLLDDSASLSFSLAISQEKAVVCLNPPAWGQHRENYFSAAI